MFVVEILLKIKQSNNADQVIEVIELLLGALRMNGQILGREFPIALDRETYRSYLLLPEEDSLESDKANRYVLKWLNKLAELNVDFSWRLVGHEPNSNAVCSCTNPSHYILYTTYLSLETPIRCGDCFGNIPLYRLPATSDGEYFDIISWESDYKACDTLQMNCTTGERFSIHHLSEQKSSLSKQGLDICNRITLSTEKPVYYYLLKPTGKGMKSELSRKCPSCGGKWLLQEPLHGLFDFRCDQCRLLSNIAWSVRSRAR